ncbi:MAG: hypothetical protein AAFY33_10565 [Cyanobacteria bacterium J06643_4]
MSCFRKPTQPNSATPLSSQETGQEAGKETGRKPAQPNEPPFSLDIPWPIATQITLGIGTLAVVTLTQAGRAAAQAMVHLGLSSEELFRGDRLPSRPLMNSEAASETDSRPR